MFPLIITSVSTFVFGYVLGKLSVKKRKSSEISIKCDTQNGIFLFTAKSASDHRIWIKSMVISNYPDFNSRIELFCNTIFENKQKKSERLNIPSEFSGELRISEIDARIQLNSGWQQCIAMIRSEETGVIIIEFVPSLESA